MKRPYHILVIDDDADDVDFLLGAFQRFYPDIRSTQVADGRMALEFLLNTTDPTECPDVAFLDLHMPVLDGYQVLIQLKANERCRDLPVMVISTSLIQDEVQKCLDTGAQDFFSKPASLEGYDPIVSATIAFLESRQTEKLSRYAKMHF